MFTTKQESMELLLFIYGLSFFVLGISVFLAKPKQSEYFFANKIWLLGIFAILHALEDWISFFKYIHLGIKFIYLNYLQSILLLASYVFLFEFSRFIIRKSFLRSKKELKNHIIYKFYYSSIIYPLATFGLLFLIFLHPTLNGINSAIRYTFGFWGALILGIGLYHYGDSLKKSQSVNKLKLYFKISGTAFILYSIFSGLIVQPTSYFPGNYINTQTFLNFFHIPVQTFRGICAIVIAITSIKALEIFRYELVVKLNESYENIKKFSSNASHQIKTPLTSLRLQIHLAIKKNKSVPEFQKTLKSIENEIVSIQDMVTNLLLLTRMQNISVREHFKKIELDGVILELYEEFSVLAKNKGVELDIEKLDCLHIKAEPTLIKILLSNLIDNAIKFTPSKKKVSIRLVKSVFIISDQGIGISKSNLSNIFEEFYRVNPPGKEHIKGYGLGLSMVKKIAEIHKLKLKILSEEGVGTKVIIKF